MDKHVAPETWSQHRSPDQDTLGWRVCAHARSNAPLVTVLQIRIIGEQGNSNKMERMQQKVCVKRARLGGHQQTWVLVSFCCM